MGATLSDHNGEASGTAYLVSGMVTGERSASLSQARFFGEASEDSAGRSLAGVGDINGDGFADISIASPHADIGELSEGAMYLVLGPVGGTNNLADADYKLGGEYVQDFLGWAMSGGEGFDINDDGFPDMLIGAYLGDSNGTNSGSAYMVLGGAW